MAKPALTILATAALSLAAVACGPAPASATTFTVLHTFTNGSDGGNPIDGVTIDKAGNLYGTAASGGSGYGTAFKLKNVHGVYTFATLYAFTSGSDGAAPGARLMPGPDGHLYGTTQQGGGGGGTVFDLGRVLRKGVDKETQLYHFGGSGSGYQPSNGDLAFARAGHIYGTTYYGGSYNAGAVYELAKTPSGWTQTILHAFGATGDGAIPYSGVIADASGNLYGTTSAGGTAGYGTVYQLVPSASGWKENVIYNFQGQNDGETPYAGLTFDKNGNLYGGATDGGSNSGGVIFELSPSASGWTFTPIYSTPGWGVSGPFRTPYVAANGTIYGTTHCDGLNSAGSIYELTYSGSTWTYTSLHDFTGGADGGYVFANPVFDAHGDVFGTTQVGGSGYGVVWEVSP